jgi:hypothetical protein
LKPDTEKAAKICGLFLLPFRSKMAVGAYVFALCLLMRSPVV